MQNPYAPPSKPESAEHDNSISDERTRSIYWRACRALCFAVAFVIAVHLCVALDEGLTEAIARTTRRPIGAVAAWIVLAIGCGLLVTLWKWIRSHFRRPYEGTLFSAVIVGLVIPFSKYLLTHLTSHATFSSIPIIWGTLLCITSVVIELEAVALNFFTASQTASGAVEKT